MKALTGLELAAAALCGVIAAGGCGDSSPRRGGTGESCVSRDDCGSGLRCVQQVCVGAQDAGADAGGAAGNSPATLGDEGDSCNAARECKLQLACLGNVCSVEGGASGVRYGTRGESCRAKNDCAPELACVGSMCVEAAIPLTRTTKQCHRIECEADADCCMDFEPDENCAAYEENCKMDPIFCNTFRTLCECFQKCEDNVCVSAPPGCGDDAECASTQTPFCVDGSCAQCAGDANCPGEDARCVDGACIAPCERNEQCALLQACMDGRCEDVGCQSDRECVFMLGQPRATCSDTECVVPCASDIECANNSMPGSFQVCEAGRCVFVGCESDEECRALLGIARTNQQVRAVCK